ncbi:MAG TPA: 50S ribosomal protein L23 [Longimicrobiales bacterium]|nr:50S ribosomal protein L23 [Longimicrobiales bacterium]
MRDPRSVILRPVVTERSTLLQDEMRTYTFIVAKNANKLEVRNAIQSLFSVRVESVRTANYQGKWRRVGRSVGRKAAYKKAVVRLAEGDSIDVYEGI